MSRLSHHGPSEARARPVPRASGATGTAIIELSLALGLLVMLLFGIISFGLTLSFRQTLTQATNEAARAASVTPSTPPTLPRERAETVVNRVMESQDTGCDDGRGLTCSFVTAACPDEPSRRCMTIRLTYDLLNHPRVLTVPGVDRLMPEVIESTVVIEVAG